MANTKTGIGFSPLTERIYLGRQNKEKRIWIGEKQDITNDFINIMFSYVPEGTTRTIGSPNLGEENIFMNIKNDEQSIRRAIKHFEKLLKK